MYLSHGYFIVLYRRKADGISIRARHVSDHDVWNPETTEDDEPEPVL